MKYTTQAEGLEVARRLTAKGGPYHMTSREEAIDLADGIEPDKVIRQKAIKSVVLTSEATKHGCPVAINLIHFDWSFLVLRVVDKYPDLRGWVVLAPGASETAAPQSTKDVVQERIAAIKRTALEAAKIEEKLRKGGLALPEPIARMIRQANALEKT